MFTSRVKHYNCHIIKNEFEEILQYEMYLNVIEKNQI